ncbi:MAG: SDR family NAD(P)-dependent oxidoreductase [Polyangia bacterium]
MIAKVGALDGKNALVTGAGRGIGRALAIGLAAEGAAVALVARSRGELDAVAAEITAAGGRAVVAVADVTDGAQVQSACRAALDAFGSIDILVNNAGGQAAGPVRFAETKPELWWRTIELNLRSAYLFCHALVPSMVERRWGRVINVGSVGSKVGLPLLTDYCAAKHGLIGLTRALAVEVASKNVTINAICPGYVDTELARAGMTQRAATVKKSVEDLQKLYVDSIPQKRAILPEECVASVLFLCSDGGGRTTGEAINISGGQVMQ